MKRMRYFLVLSIFCLLVINVRAENKAPQKPLGVEEINIAVLEQAGWVVSGHTSMKEKNGVLYRNWNMTTDEQEPQFVFNRRRIVAESIALIQPDKSSLPSTYEYLIYSYYSEQPTGIIIYGKEVSGEKRTFFALRRKDGWEFYSMRTDIKWRLEYDKSAEPEFAANIAFD